MTEPQSTEKFIAYFDILGWKSIVQAAEEGRGLSVAELLEIVSALGTDEDRQHFEKYGPITCPEAPCVRKDMEFQITRISDCVIISAEVSPAGVINLVSHCWTAYFKLLAKGIMCRGYIKRGRIIHTGKYQIGTGLSDAVERERQVSIFKQDADERGTPFIEVDKELVQYVADQPDQCVKEMFSRLVVAEGDLAAIFPFKRLNHSFMIGGFGTTFDPEKVGTTFDPEKERASLNVVRDWIQNMKEQVQRHLNPAGGSVLQKGNHYIRLLDAQLVACDRTEESIDHLMQPYPAHRMKDVIRDTE